MIIFYAQIELEVTDVQPSNEDDRERFIDESLKRLYQEALDEGVPDRFKDLLSQLKQQDHAESRKK